jgi:hypothetical protein
VQATPDFIAAFEKFRAGDIPNVVADLKSQGVMDGETLVKHHLAMIDKWTKLVNANHGDRAGYLKLLEQNIYGKAKF